jgi:hypothetical protein
MIVRWMATHDPKRSAAGGGGCRRWLAVALGLWWGLARGGAPVWAHSERATVAVRTYTAVTVDGTLQEWGRRLERTNWAGRLEVQKGQVLEWIRAVPLDLNTMVSRVESGAVKGPHDFSATVYTLWDPQHVYVAAVVTDDEVITQHQGEGVWQDDALELWLDCRHDAVTHTMFQDDEYQLGFSPAGRDRGHALGWAWRNPQPQPVIEALQVASSLTPTGYILEASVPWQVLQGCQPAAGGMIGFNVSLVDKDSDQLWTHVTWSGELHSDPSQFGHLYFVDAPVDLFPEDVFDVPSTSVSF